jgi:hypothetical protein
METDWTKGFRSKAATPNNEANSVNHPLTQGQWSHAMIPTTNATVGSSRGDKEKNLLYMWVQRYKKTKKAW